jgi:hypothetical protein
MNYFILAKIGNVNMKKTFQKTLIAAAAGVALMSAAGTASANSLLFPYFTTTTGAQSVLSISANNTAAVGGETLHYVYNYGSSCTHFDGNGKLTQNDLLQHSVAATAAGGFGKAVSTDASTPFYFPLANSYGFLTVTNKTTTGAVISGEMAIVDPSTGLVASYAGISNGLETVATTNEGDFSSITDQKFDLRFFGSGVTSTSWYGVVVGNMYAAITAGANWTGGQTLTNNGVVYNNDESPISGTATKNIVCAGSFTANDLMNTAQQAAVGSNGGLIHSTASSIAAGGLSGAVGYTSTGLVLMKLQAVQAAVGAPFAGKQFLHREAATPF